MKFIMRIIIFLLLLSANVYGEELKDSVRVGLFAYTVLNVADIMQTAYIYDHEEYYEMNPLLSKDMYLPIMMTTNILLYYIVKKIDPNRQNWIIWPVVIIKAGLVVHNHSIGIGFGIPF